MKKYLSIFLFFISIFILTACKTSDNASEVPSTSEIEEQPLIASDSKPSAIIESEIYVSDFNELPDDIKGTIIPIDSLLLYYAETGNGYDSSDSYMLWRTLQYAFGNFGVNYHRADLKDYSLCVEPINVGEFTTSILDGDYKNYPIPKELSDNIWYDSSDDLYHFGLGDRGLSQTEILSYQYLEDHNLRVNARLYGLDDDTTICSGTFYLKRNDYASGVVEPLFYYTVTDVEYINK